MSCLSKLYHRLEPTVFTGLAQVLDLLKLKIFSVVHCSFLDRGHGIELDI